MSAETRDALLDAAALDRLSRVCDVDAALLLTGFGGPDSAPGTPLATALRDTEVLFTGWGCPPLDEEALARMPGLRAVVHAAGSLKNHMTEAAWARGLTATSATAANALPVAEFTVAAVLFANKGVLLGAHALRTARARPDLATLLPGIGNYRRTVGIVGASTIGRRVVELLRPYDLRVLVNDPYLSAADADALGATPMDLDPLLRESDVVSVHAPELPETRHLLDERRLALMRDGTTLVNTARGSLVDTGALTRELVAGRLNAVLDVTDPEPLPADSPLYDLPNVLLTPHLAGSLGGELARLADFAIDELERYADRSGFAHAVRPTALHRSA
ncbi:NAD(P)-dependent oxidoreductase [Streptomyces sp. NPDC008150]|uniref:hydroxyacid dehydrogenase n=1 Tax=Streptomyces sp. NPDC008150 TaxID=3364816 RepID=UPI0036E20CBA